MEQQKGKQILPTKNTPLSELVSHLKLIFALIGDGRVNIFLKIIPIIGFVYLISPIDLSSALPIPIIDAIDDIGVLWFTQYLFIELIPSHIVDEVRLSIEKKYSGKDNKDQAGEVIDGEVREVK